MKVLVGGYAGAVDEGTIGFWCAVLNPLTDEQVLAATTIVGRTWINPFLPPPAVLFQAVAPAQPVVDSEAIVRQISKLGAHHPNAGWIYPSIAVVQEKLGEAIGYAYTAAGGPRLFAENETTRDIAKRDFQKALLEAESRPSAPLPIVGARSLPTTSESSVTALVSAAAAALTISPARRPPAVVPEYKPATDHSAAEAAG
jgi:hypothetical protein